MDDNAAAAPRSDVRPSAVDQLLEAGHAPPRVDMEVTIYPARVAREAGPVALSPSKAVRFAEDADRTAAAAATAPSRQSLPAGVSFAALWSESGAADAGDDPEAARRRPARQPEADVARTAPAPVEPTTAPAQPAPTSAAPADEPSFDELITWSTAAVAAVAPDELDDVPSAPEPVATTAPPEAAHATGDAATVPPLADRSDAVTVPPLAPLADRFGERTGGADANTADTVDVDLAGWEPTADPAPHIPAASAPAPAPLVPLDTPPVPAPVPPARAVAAEARRAPAHAAPNQPWYTAAVRSRSRRSWWRRLFGRR